MLITKLIFKAAVKTEKFSVLATIRDWPIMLIFCLCYAAVLMHKLCSKLIMLKSKYFALPIITICIQIFLYKSLLIADNVESLF